VILDRFDRRVVLGGVLRKGLRRARVLDIWRWEYGWIIEARVLPAGKTIGFTRDDLRHPACEWEVEENVV